MADPISSLRTNRGEPTLFDRLSTSGQISQEDQYAANPENQFSKGLRTGAAGLTASSFASEALRQEVAGDPAFEGSRDRALQTVRDTQMYAPRVSSLRDVNSVSDFGDFAAGAIGQGAMSMAPALAAAVLTRGRSLGNKAAAFGGSMVPSYELERGEAALNQYQDPAQMAASAEERDLAATAKGGINAALESIVPAGIGSAFLRKPAGSLLGHVGRDTATEFATEGAQQVVGFGAQKYIDPTKELDPWDVADAAVAGGLTGGAMSLGGRAPSYALQAAPQVPEVRNPFRRDEAAPDQGGVPPGGAPGGEGMFDKVAGLGAAVQDRFGEDIAAAGAKTAEAAGKAKDFVSETVDRMTEAVKTAENPGDFLSKVFSGNVADEAAADLSGEPNPALKGLTFEETEANIARDDAKRAARAARYAEELLNDPATPSAVKQRVVDMGGDFTNPDNQSFVARTLVSQRAGEKTAKAVQDLIDLGKTAFSKGAEAASTGASKAKKALGDAADAAQERIVKKNMQSASPAEQAAFSKVIFDNLTEEAKASTFVRAQLSQVASVLMAFAAKTGDITAKDLPTLTKLSGAMSLFKDPDAVVAQLVEYGAIPRDSDSFLGRIKSIQSARSDIKQPNSFLYTSLTPEAKDSLTGPMLQRLAQLVDEFSLRDASGDGDRILEGLAQAFGSKESAQAVLDFYAQQNKANVRFDPNEQVRDAGGEIDSDELSSWDGSINERDAGKAAFRFKDAKSMRPFFKGSKDIDAARRDGTLGDESTQQPYSYAEYVKETGKKPGAELRRLVADIDKRIAGHEARKGEDRSALINALKGERSMLEAAYKKGGVEEALSMYEVLRTEAKDQNDLVATDEDLAKYSFKKGASRVTFKRTDGTKLMLSAESMWKTFGDKTKGETSGGKEGDTARARRLFNEAVASVLARPDIESLETSLSGLKIDSKGTEAEPKIDPVLREQIAHELNKASGSLSELKAGLQNIFRGYAAALSQGNLGKQLVYTTEETVRDYITNARKALDGATTAPQRAVLRERLMAYERGLERMMEMKQNYLDDGVGGNNNTDELDPPIFSRLRKEMDTSNNERRVEEDTGAPVGTGGAPKTGTGVGPTDIKAKNRVFEEVEPIRGQKRSERTPYEPNPIRFVNGKAKKNPAAASREKAAKIDDTSALSADAFTALHDVAVKENWGRLDTPVKVLRFAAMARKALEQINKTPELDRTDEQDLLRYKLKDMFDQDKGAAFDWDSLWDGLEPTDAQKAQLEGIVRPKAEPGTTRQSTMDPLRGNATSVLTKDEQQKIIDEIVRIRGKDVKVSFGKFADIGGSGEFSMNADKTERLIRIAISSINPMSVAWHESLHDFMAMLGGSKAERKLKADLLAAAEAPQVVTKLRELLKGHPKALEQIESDREERLAYMYQFWAEGLLPLGTTGSNIFSRAARFFREMLGVLSQDEKIEQLLTALHTGKFAEPSLVATVLQDLKANTLGDKAREVAGPLADLADTMFTGATDRLRDTNIDALAELADMFHREPGREKTGELPFLQRRAQQVGKRLNKLQDILKDTTAEDRRRALENMQSMKAPSSKLEKDLAAYLKEMRDYMVDRGVKRFDSESKKWVPLGDVKNYFPRVWDKEIIRNNEADFIKLLTQYIGAAQARETFNALVNGDGSLELAENEHSLGFTPWNPAVLDRQFTFINQSNAADFAKFQTKDMAEIMTSYTQRAVHRAEYSSSFGNNGEVITQKFLEAQKQGATPEELAMARKATMAMEGTLGYEFNPRLKEVMSGIVTYQNIVLLPLSLFSNLIDPLGVAMRSNDMKEAWRSFVYGIKGIADQIRGAGDDAQTEMARTLGLIDDQNMLEAMGHIYNSMHMSRFLKNINSKFFRYNGMEMWNQRMRVSAMMAAQRFIVAQAEIIRDKNAGNHNAKDDSALRNAKRYFSELGIDENDVFVQADGTLAVLEDQILAAGAKKSDSAVVTKRIQAAVFKWVDGAVLRPNAAHRPIWGSDPRYQLIFHLKQFTFSFHNTILRRVGEELKHGNVAPGWILLSYVPFMFLSDVMKGSLTGTINTTADLYEVASRSIARSGIMGTSVFGVDALGDVERGNLPGSSFLGPAFGHLTTLLDGITGYASAGQVVDRSVPFAKLF
jgi:hypothetical protein